ncbi:unnamed protein product [Discosporangium mesarthrocarpum]
MLAYILSWEGLVDLVSMLPVFGYFKRWIYSLAFVRYLRVGKAIKSLQLWREVQAKTRDSLDDDIVVRVGLLIAKVVALVFTVTAIIYGTEAASSMIYDDDGGGTYGAFNEPDMRWHDAFYFTVVTLSTVG